MTDDQIISVNAGGAVLSLDQFWALAHIEDQQRDASETMQFEVIEKWGELLKFDSPVILGSFSWFHMAAKHKFVYKHNARYGVVPHTPADRAKWYLKYKGLDKARKRVTRNQYDAVIKRKRSSPLYARVGEFPDMVYMDVVSAYWSIMKIVGWDVDYYPNRWLGVSSDLDDFPYADDKLARNCLASAGLMGNMRMWTGDKLVWVKTYNKNINMMLWNFLQDVLHGIGSEMVRKADAVYVHTDGYIIPKSNTLIGMDIIASWGLVAGIKYEGNTIIRGAGDYDIGSRKSKRRLPIKSRNHNSLYPISSAWLRNKMFRFSSR